MSGVDLRVRFEWSPAGPVTLDGAGHLVLPDLPTAPGIYRWTLTGPDGVQQYIGEGGSLRGRLRDYRRPSSLRTANRLHGVIAAHLAAGGRAHLDVATTGEVERPGISAPLDLARRTARHLAEHAAIAEAYLDGTPVLNRDTA
ncbi:hypothetical protein [Pseudonocardia sp. NPDC049635]|uniref:hypothetical protein n=1 Tax=Pseudonocardia sp. NPDC049635 TaxID=3155506 RepID=UPI0033EF8275